MSLANRTHIPESLWAIRKLEEATVEAYADSTPQERHEGDILLARLNIALHEPAEPEFCCHG